MIPEEVDVFGFDIKFIEISLVQVRMACTLFTGKGGSQ